MAVAKKKTVVKKATTKKATAKPAIDKKKDTAARKLDTKAAKNKKEKKPNKGISKDSVMKEAAEHATPSAKKSARKVRGYKTTAQKKDPLLGLLEVDAIEDCIKGVEDYYRETNGMVTPDDMTIDETMFALEFIATNFNTQQAAANTRRARLGDDHESDKLENDPDFYHVCTTIGKRYLTKYRVREFIQQQINNRIERLQVTEDWVWSKYRNWARTDVTQLIEIKEQKGRQIITLKENINDLPLEIRTAITSVTVTTMGDIKVEFVNQKAALDQLCKLMNIGNDKVDLNTGEIHMHFDAQDGEA